MSRPVIDDLNVMVAGQGGDGSLTLITLLSDVLGLRGFELYLSRNVASRVKGGTAFYAALVAEVGVFACFKFTNISFLWYNVIGCVAVVGLAWGFSWLQPRAPGPVSSEA